MKPHAFVAMPFGTKLGPDGQPIDFNRVYAEYIEPALKAAGLEVFRADEEQRAGDIRTDMFQELLLADPETWALLGRVDKDAWTSAWRQPGNASCAYGTAAGATDRGERRICTKRSSGAPGG